MSAYVYGVGSTNFGKQRDTSPSAPLRTAVVEALTTPVVDAVDAVFAGTVFGAPGTVQRALQTLRHHRGADPHDRERLRQPARRRSTRPVAAVSTPGRFEHVLALGVETMTLHFGGAIHPEATDREGRTGPGLPGIYAMSANRYQHEFGVTDEQWRRCR